MVSVQSLVPYMTDDEYFLSLLVRSCCFRDQSDLRELQARVGRIGGRYHIHTHIVRGSRIKIVWRFHNCGECFPFAGYRCGNDRRSLVCSGSLSRGFVLSMSVAPRQRACLRENSRWRPVRNVKSFSTERNSHILCSVHNKINGPNDESASCRFYVFLNIFYARFNLLARASQTHRFAGKL